MSARVYMLLDIMEGNSTYAIQTLRSTEGVVIADTLEGHPNILVIIEAPDRQRLVELMMPVLGSVDHITEDLHLLVTRENSLPPRFFDAGSMKSYTKQSVN
jgi:hypothetical protein